MSRRRAAMLLLALLIALTGEPARAARNKPVLKTDRIVIEYIEPQDARAKAIYQMVKQRQALERFQYFLSPLRLPAPLRLEFKFCDGEVNAWYREARVTVCYEYIDDVIRTAPRDRTPEGVTYQDAIIGPIVEVFLHEVGHAVFHMLDIPVLGRAEDAADQFAAFLILMMSREEARRTIRGVAFMLARDAREEVWEQTEIKRQSADEHGLAAQRYYNILCMAYGANPASTQDLVEHGLLPKERAERCGGEYQQVQKAFRKLIAPYFDMKRVREAQKRPWLPPPSDTDWRDLAVDR